MACRTLDETVVRAKDLEDVNIISVMDVYAVISISGDPQTRQRTHIHAEAHRNPRWNESFRFTIPTADPGHLALHVRLCSQRIFGVSDIGDVYVPLRDLLAEPAGDLLSFPVRSTSGAKNGSLFLSYKVGEPVRDPSSSGKSLVRPWAAKAAATYDEPPSPPAKTNRAEEVEEVVPAYLPPPTYAPWGPHVPAIGYPPYMPPYGYDEQPPQPRNGYRYTAPPPQGVYRYDVPPRKNGRRSVQHRAGRRANE